MATNINMQGFIGDLIREAQAGQSITKQKANTVTTAIGICSTAILAGIAYAVEHNVEGVGDWAPIVVSIIGAISTIIGVSKTRNGITSSVADQLNAALNSKIGSSHFDHAPVNTDGANPSQGQLSWDQIRAEAINLARP